MRDKRCYAAYSISNNLFTAEAISGCSLSANITFFSYSVALIGVFSLYPKVLSMSSTWYISHRTRRVSASGCACPLSHPYSVLSATFIDLSLSLRTTSCTVSEFCFHSSFRTLAIISFFMYSSGIYKLMSDYAKVWICLYHYEHYLQSVVSYFL